MSQSVRALSIGKWLLIALAAAFMLWRFRELSLRAAADHALVNQLSASVEALQQRPASTLRIVEREVSSAPAPEAVKEQPREPDPLMRAPSVQQPRPRKPLPPKAADPAVTAARFESTYADEHTDWTWATETTKELRATIDSLGLARNIEFLECRTSLCRIQSSFPDRETYNQFMDALAVKVSGGDGMISPDVQREPKGGLRALSYWVRAGKMRDLTSESASGEPSP